MPPVIGVVLGLLLGLLSLYLVFRVLFRAREARPAGRRSRRGGAPGKRRRTLHRPRTY